MDNKHGKVFILFTCFCIDIYYIFRIYYWLRIKHISFIGTTRQQNITSDDAFFSDYELYDQTECTSENNKSKWRILAKAYCV